MRSLAFLTLSLVLTGCHTYLSDSRVVWSTPGRHLEVNYSGEVELALEGEPIRYLSPGGRLHIVDRTSRRRELLALGQGDGKIEFRYRLDGRQAELDEEAQRWIRSVVERVIQKTSIGARSRARRILEEEGAEGLLRQIEKREVSAAVVYLDVLMLDGELSASQLSRAVAATSRQVSGSVRLRNIVRRAAALYPDDLDLTTELVAATRRIPSSQSASQALQSIFRERRLPPQAAPHVNGAVRSISSSTGQARALQALFASRQVAPEVLHTGIRAVEAIPSSSAQASALQAALTRQDLDLKSQREIALAAMSIPSSSAQTKVLRRLAEDCALDEQVVSALLTAISEVPAATHRRDLLSAVLDRQPLPPSSQEQTRMIIDDLPSSYAKPLFSKMLAQRAR